MRTALVIAALATTGSLVAAPASTYALGAPRLGWVIVYVPDVARAVAFYERAFGLRRRFVHESGEYAEMETGGTTLAFSSEKLASSNGVRFRPNRAATDSAGVEIALAVDDVAAAHAKALAAGAAEVSGSKTKPWGQTVSYVRDQSGVLVELCSPLPAR